MTTQKLKAIAQAFNFSRESLDLDLDHIQISWEDVANLIAEYNMSQEGFAYDFMGGLVTRETVTRSITKKTKMSRSMKFMIITCLKQREEWLDKAMKKHKMETCDHCGSKKRREKR